jgi:hypothetical protein
MTPLRISRNVLEQARQFFEERGAEGMEGTAVIGRRNGAVADHLVIPDQHADRGLGCWVEVTVAGKLELAAALAPDEQYVARIHSHPGEAFHSKTDDRNPALTQEGALSMVVPYFGLGLRRGLDACAVYVRKQEQWIELPPGPERSRWVEVE